MPDCICDLSRFCIDRQTIVISALKRLFSIRVYGVDSFIIYKGMKDARSTLDRTIELSVVPALYVNCGHVCLE